MVKPTSPAFKTIRRTVVAHEAVDVIKQMIVAGDLQPGQRLPSERDLAVHLGLSRPSLREAIRALIALNILESRHGEGTFVSSLEPELLSEPIDFLLQINDGAIQALFEARRVLEAGVASLAAVRASDLELAELEDFVKQGRTKVDDVDAFIDHDIEFHRRISRTARSPILASLLESVSALSVATRHQTAQSSAVRMRSLADHRAMVKTLKARDPQAAHEAMIAHLDHVLAAFGPVEAQGGRPSGQVIASP